MNILYAKWNSYMAEDVHHALVIKHDVFVVNFILEGFSMNPKSVKDISNAFSSHHFDIVFTINYYPEISSICEQYNTKYISWIYDAPCIMLYDKSVLNKCNYIYSFDKQVVNELSLKGVKNIYYLPLAVEKCFQDVIPCTNFISDVTFVGSTYSEKLNLYNQCYNAFPEYIKGYITSLIESQLLLDGYFVLGDALSDEAESIVKSTVKLEPPEGFLMSFKDFFANFILGAKATSRQRIHTLNTISEACNLNIHCIKPDGLLSDKITIKGPVDHDHDLGKLYASSKINLNITMTNIQNGIPLRCFDIMGSGGFLLTNYREAFTDLFTDGEDFVIYYDTDDMKAKIEYYLVHEDERIAIARNGQKKVRSLHTVPKKIDYMLNNIT